MWSTDGWTFYEPYADYGDEPWMHTGLWHVTTAARAVTRDGRLKSRAELRAAGIRAPGLGGGPRDVAPDLVSATTQPENAQLIYRALLTAALAAANRLPAWRVAAEALAFSNFDALYDEHVYVMEAYGDEADETDREVQRQLHDLRTLLCLPPPTHVGELPTQREVRAAAACLERRHGTGEAKYRLIDQIEDFGQYLSQTMAGEHLRAPVGFTAPWRVWAQTDPRSIRVLRLAGRVGAWTEAEPSEQELRFRPQDLRVVGVENMWGLVPLARASQLRLGARNRRGRRVVAARQSNK